VAHKGLKNAAQGFVAAIPDLEMRIEEEIVEGDMVAVRASTTATQRGEFRGYPASGKRWQATASAWYRLTDGRISNASINWDWLAIMEAMGAVSWTEAARPAAASVRRHP